MVNSVQHQPSNNGFLGNNDEDCPDCKSCSGRLFRFSITTGQQARAPVCCDGGEETDTCRVHLVGGAEFAICLLEASMAVEIRALICVKQLTASERTLLT